MGHTQGLWEAVTRPSDGQIFGRDKAEYIIPASATEAEAITAWNTRTPALEAGVVDKLVEAASVAVEELDYIAEFAMRQTEWTGDDDAALLAVKNLRAALALARGEQA